MPTLMQGPQFWSDWMNVQYSGKASTLTSNVIWLFVNSSQILQKKKKENKTINYVNYILANYFPETSMGIYWESEFGTWLNDSILGYTTPSPLPGSGLW